MLSLIVGGAGCGAGFITMKYVSHVMEYAESMRIPEVRMNEFYEEYIKILEEGRAVVTERDDSNRT